MGSLTGKTILVTRPEHQAADLTQPLELLGAETYILPAMRVAPPLDEAAFDRALQRLGGFDWIVLTSVNGVEAVRRRLSELHLTWPAGPRLAVIGPATAEAATQAFGVPDAMPTEYISEAIADAIGNFDRVDDADLPFPLKREGRGEGCRPTPTNDSDLKGMRILLARADRARKELADILAERGAEVESVVAYRLVQPGLTEGTLPKRPPDAIALTSATGAKWTYDNLAARGRESWMRNAALVCIGPITADAVRELGFTPAATATEYTMPGLIAAIVETLADKVAC